MFLNKQIPMFSVFLLLLLLILKVSSERDKFYVISDTHLNSQMMTEENEKELKRFLMKIADSDTECYKLIIAGDFIEGWSYPINEEIPIFVDLISDIRLDGTFLTDILQSILDNEVYIRVITGNHDHFLSQSDFDPYMQSVQYHSLLVFPDHYQMNNYMVEHGSKFDLFNTFVYHYDDRSTFLPFEYLFSRLSATFGEGKDDISLPTCTFVHAIRSEVVMLAILLSSFNGNDVLDNIPEAIEIYTTDEWPDFTSVRIQDGCYYCSSDQDNIDVNEISVRRFIKKVLPTFERAWKEINMFSDYEYCFDVGFPQSSLTCNFAYKHLMMNIMVGLEKKGFEYFLQSYFGELRSNLVLFGHTHQTSDFITRLHNKDGKMVYVNVGSWVNEEIRTYGRVHVDEDKYATKVDICQFTSDEDCVILDSEFVCINGNSSTHDHAHDIPDGWKCDPSMYGDGKVCDCDCGAYDLDCNETLSGELPSNCYDLSPLLPSTCETLTGSFKCVYKRPEEVPEEWSCDPDLYMNIDHICYCNCTIFDPICVVAREIRGCSNDEYKEHANICYEDGIKSSQCLLVPSNVYKSHVPQNFKCPQNWYGTEDGCDCDCGDVPDPDCFGHDVCGCTPTNEYLGPIDDDDDDDGDDNLSQGFTLPLVLFVVFSSLGVYFFCCFTIIIYCTVMVGLFVFICAKMAWKDQTELDGELEDDDEEDLELKATRNETSDYLEIGVCESNGDSNMKQKDQVGEEIQKIGVDSIIEQRGGFKEVNLL